MTAGTFDCFAADVLEGRKLIESSAGTGKTYTIASLYIRLLVEKELQVGKILVVTFTKAATEELKGRIRKNIRETLSVLEGGRTDDDFIRALHASLESRGKVDDAAELLRNALRMFDEAAIFTIHGFCGRVLKDNAFESASLFDTELVTDGADLVKEIAADFYRMRIHGELTPYRTRYLADPLGHFIGHGLSVDALAQFIRDNASKPFLSILPDLAETANACAAIGAVEAAFETAWRDAVDAWRSEKDGIMALVGGGMLNRRSYTASVRARMAEKMDALAGGEPEMPDFTHIERFRPAFMEGKNNGNPLPAHRFFDLFEALFQASAALGKAYLAPVLHMRHELIAYANAELAERKRRRNIRFYDDLLQDLMAALSGPGRKALVDRVRERYAVGLIDEFQDTDLLQYEIFDAFFPAGSTLFLIGDPKQAIYSFRGADVFAY
ncbi:MAG TPA: UvrD-helicase domain-containing protein, partial [Candidatus Deferrimicrobiaceae bacterium]